MDWLQERNQGAAASNENTRFQSRRISTTIQPRWPEAGFVDGLVQPSKVRVAVVSEVACCVSMMDNYGLVMLK